MPSLYAQSGGVNRQIKKLYANSGGINRQLKELWAQNSNINRKIFNSAITWTYGLAWSSNTDSSQLNINNSPGDTLITLVDPIGASTTKWIQATFYFSNPIHLPATNALRIQEASASSYNPYGTWTAYKADGSVAFSGAGYPEDGYVNGIYISPGQEFDISQIVVRMSIQGNSVAGKPHLSVQVLPIGYNPFYLNSTGTSG